MLDVWQKMANLFLIEELLSVVSAGKKFAPRRRITKYLGHVTSINHCDLNTRITNENFCNFCLCFLRGVRFHADQSSFVHTSLIFIGNVTIGYCQYVV